MRIPSFGLCYLPLLVLTCSACVEVGSAVDSKAGSPNSGGGSNDGSASNPQNVTGSYLTDCANVGYLGFGCAVTDPATKQKVSESVTQLQVQITYTDNTTGTPQVTPAQASDPWHGYFPVDASKIGNIKSIAVSALVDGNPVQPTALQGSQIGAKPQPVNPLAATSNVIFVTRQTYNPGLSGFPDTDSIAAECEALGQVSTFIPNAAGLKWTALLSVDAADAGDSSPNISTFIGALTAPVINTAGIILSNTPAEFWGPHLAAIDTDQNGEYIGAGALVWTGSDANGNEVEGSTCQGWQEPTTGSGVVGSASDLTQWLNNGTPQPCSSAQHIYCFGAL